MNKKQKKVLFAGIAVIILSLIIWLGYGGEIFTKDQVLVEKYDELFDTTYSEFEDKFIWGLDLSLLISGITVTVSLALIFLLRTKKASKKN